MPNGDGTGPMGIGSKTGKGMGFCSGFSSPGFTRGPGIGQRRGFGSGWRRGPRRGFGLGFIGRRFGFAASQQVWKPQPVYPTEQPAPLTKDQEKQMLEDEFKAIEEDKKALAEELEAIKKRIKELQK